MSRFAAWLFLSPGSTAPPWRVILWWEARRIAFNVIVGAYGVLCLAVFSAAIASGGRPRPGEDGVEPLALLAVPIVLNLLYTLGWIVEANARLFFEPGLSPRFGPRLLKLGLGLALILSTIPAASWSGYPASTGSRWRRGCGPLRRRSP